jgi:hypothetical protein
VTTSGRRYRGRFGSLLRLLPLAGVMLALVSPSARAAAGAVVPTVDCAVANPDGTLTAYFGYLNTSSATNIAIGNFNQFVPGFADEGQPTRFSPGSYSRVMSVTFSPTIVPAVGWLLEGVTAVANSSTPGCYAGATGASSDIGQTVATLNALIDPRGQATTYHFDWGRLLPTGIARRARR